MEFPVLKRVFCENGEDLTTNEGIQWFVLIESESAGEISKLRNHIKLLDIECEINGLVLLASDDLQAKVSHQDPGIKFYLLDNKSKEELRIASIPWFICKKNSKIIYSSQDFPDSILVNPEGNIEIGYNDKNTDKESKLNTELLKFSQVIDGLSEKKLSKALKKVEKLEMKIKLNDQIIENYKIEMNNLKAKIESNVKIEREEPKKVETYNMKTVNLTWKKVENKWKSRFDDNEFWKIESLNEDEYVNNFENSDVMKSLWLVGLLRNSEETKIFQKPKPVLSPIRQNKNRTFESEVINKLNNHRKSNIKKKLPDMQNTKLVKPKKK